MKKLLKLLEWTGTLLLALAIVLAGFILIGPGYGWGTYAVLSGSMEPALRTGGIIVTQPVSNVRVGDIITFQPPGQDLKVTHRVVDIVEKDGRNWFQTKGDANEEPDADLIAFRGDKIEKVLFHLPYAGFVASFMNSKWGFVVLVGVPALVLIMIFGRNAWEGIREEKEKRRIKTACPEKDSKAPSE